jgi:uncharacterized protein (TIGR03083 family)
MPDVGRLYADVRGSITALLDGADVDRIVPPCPEWRVKDVVAHVSGVCVDILAGRLDGVATDPWTARQVDERKDWPIKKIVDEWTESAVQCEGMAELFGDAGVQWVADVTTHEHDLRCALAQPGRRDSEPVVVAFPWLIEAIAGQGFTPAFRVVTPEGDDRVVGEGSPEAVVRAPRFEVFRALTGRRSEDQIGSFDWDGDYRRFLSAFNREPFTVAASPIVE